MVQLDYKVAVIPEICEIDIRGHTIILVRGENSMCNKYTTYLSVLSKSLTEMRDLTLGFGSVAAFVNF